MRQWILERQGRGLSPRQLCFWQLILDLPKKTVDRWLAEPGRSVWDGRTRRRFSRKFCQGCCRLASLDDLAAMKLSALAQRGAKKDFVDLYALCLRHRPLDRLVKIYQRRFGVADMGHLLYSLTYFREADAERLPPLLWKSSRKNIKECVLKWVKDLAGPGVGTRRES